MNTLQQDFSSSAPLFPGEATNQRPVFIGTALGSQEIKKDYVLTSANNCRGDWYNPIFSDESKYLETNQVVNSLEKSGPWVNEATALNPDGTLQGKDTSSLTVPPQKKVMSDLTEGLLIGGAVFLIIKILS